MFAIRSQLCDVFIISYGRREINTLLLSFDKTQKFISDIFTECNVSHETLKCEAAFFLAFTMILSNRGVSSFYFIHFFIMHEIRKKRLIFL